MNTFVVLERYNSVFLFLRSTEQTEKLKVSSTMESLYWDFFSLKLSSTGENPCRDFVSQT